MKIYRILAAIIFVLIIIAAFIFYYNINPSGGNGLMCWFKGMFGLDCFSCGGQRALHHILNGDITSALRYNPLLVIISPFLIFLLYTFVRSYLLGFPDNSKILYSKRLGPIVIIVIVGYTILRNLPWFPFTLLAPPN